MVKSTAIYQGDLHCEATHGPSQKVIETDAPTDNKGRGEAFSPTDLVGAALSTCILTTMAIVAERDGVEFKNARAEVEKTMVDTPKRRIGKLALKITLPNSIPAEYRKKIEHIAHACPVHRSLHPDLEIPVEFIYE
jgi:putative redox protein